MMCERISFESGSIQALIHLCLFKARVTEEEEVEVERCAPGATGQIFFTCKDTIVIIHQTDFKQLTAFASGKVLLISAY